MDRLGHDAGPEAEENKGRHCRYPPVAARRGTPPHLPYLMMSSHSLSCIQHRTDIPRPLSAPISVQLRNLTGTSPDGDAFITTCLESVSSAALRGEWDRQMAPECLTSGSHASFLTLLPLFRPGLVSPGRRVGQNRAGQGGAGQARLGTPPLTSPAAGAASGPTSFCPGPCPGPHHRYAPPANTE